MGSRGSAAGLAGRSHGERHSGTVLSFPISVATVSRYLPRGPVKPDQVKRWIAFLYNRKDAIAAIDVITVATAPLRHRYAFFVIDHDRSAHFGFQRRGGL